MAEDTPDAGRRVAQVMLDAISVYRTEDENTEIMQRALDELWNIPAIRIAVDDDGDELDVQVNADDLVGGVLLLAYVLVKQLEVELEQPREQIVAWARERVDEVS